MAAPVLVSAEFGSQGTATITLTFDQNLAGSVNVPDSAFDVRANGVSVELDFFIESQLGNSPQQWFVYTHSEFLPSDFITIAYTQPANTSARLRNTANEYVASFTAQPVTNTRIANVWLAGNSPKGIIRREDSISSWSLVNAGPTGVTIQAVAIHPGSRDSWIAGTNGLYIRTFLTGIWSARIPTPSGVVHGLTIDPRNGEIWIAMSGTNRLFRSLDNGQSWSDPIIVSVVTDATHYLTGITIDPRNGDIWVSGALPNRLYKSADGGANFYRVETGPTGQNLLTGVAVNPLTGELFASGDSPDQVYRSTNDGSGWSTWRTPPTGQSSILDIHVEMPNLIPKTEIIDTVGAGSWTVPANVQYVLVEVVGGGGGGGADGRSASGGRGGDTSFGGQNAFGALGGSHSTEGDTGTRGADGIGAEDHNFTGSGTQRNGDGGGEPAGTTPGSGGRSGSAVVPALSGYGNGGDGGYVSGTFAGAGGGGGGYSAATLPVTPNADIAYFVGGGGQGGQVGAGNGQDGQDGVIRLSYYQPDTIVPTFVSAEIGGYGDSIITLTFSEPLDEFSRPEITAFIVRVGGELVTPLSNGPGLLGTEWNINLGDSLNETDTVTIEYVQPADASEQLQDIVGNLVASFSAQPVTNTIGTRLSVSISGFGIASLQPNPTAIFRVSEVSNSVQFGRKGAAQFRTLDALIHVGRAITGTAVPFFSIRLGYDTQGSRAGQSGRWVGTGANRVPASALRQNSASDIIVTASSLFDVIANLNVLVNARFTAEIERGEFVFRATDGTLLLLISRSELGSYSTGVGGYLSSNIIALSRILPLLNIDADIIFEAVPQIVSIRQKGFARFESNDAHLTVSPPVRLSGAGTAFFFENPTTLTVTEPDAALVSGEGETTLRSTGSIALDVTPSAPPVPFGGIGAATFGRASTVSLQVTSPAMVMLAGQGIARIRRRNTRLSVTSPTMVQFSGDGEAFFTTASITLTVESEEAVSVAGESFTTFDIAPAAVLTRTAQTPVMFGGRGVGSFYAVAEDRNFNAPTDSGGRFVVFNTDTTAWVLDIRNRTASAITLATGDRDSDKDIPSSVIEGALGSFFGLEKGFTDGTTAWILEPVARRLVAFNLASKTHDSAKDFDLRAIQTDAGSTSSQVGAFSDGTTTWILDAAQAESRAWAFNIASKTRDSAKDLSASLLREEGERSDRDMGRIFSDGITLWTISFTYRDIQAYHIASKTRDEQKDFPLAFFSTFGSSFRTTDGLTNGETIWISPQDRRYLAFTYSQKAPLALTKPASVSIVGSDSASFRVQATTLAVSGAGTITFGGTGAATFRTNGVTLTITTAGEFPVIGSGSASFRTPPSAVLTSTSTPPVSFSGTGIAAFGPIGRLPANLLPLTATLAGSGRIFNGVFPRGLETTYGTNTIAFANRGYSTLTINPGTGFLQDVVSEANLRIENNRGELVYDGPIPSQTQFTLTLDSTSGRNLRRATTGIDLIFSSRLDITAELSVISGILFVGKGSARFRTRQTTTLMSLGAGTIEFAGIGSASFSTNTPTLTMTSPTPVTFGGAGSATVATQATTLSVIAPTPVAVSGQGLARFNLRASRRLQVSAANSIPVSGEGEARFIARGVTLDLTRVQQIALGGSGTAAFTTTPATLARTAPVAITFGGVGSAALRSAQAVTVTVTVSAPVTLSGTGRARFRAARRARLRVQDAGTITFGGTGAATFSTTPAVLEKTAPTPITFGGVGSAVLRTRTARLTILNPTLFAGFGSATFIERTAALTRRAAMPITLSGQGSARILFATARIIRRSPSAVRFGGAGAATFRTDAVTLGVVSAGEFPVIGSGSTTLRTPPAIALTRTPTTPVTFSGTGVATFGLVGVLPADLLPVSATLAGSIRIFQGVFPRGIETIYGFGVFVAANRSYSTLTINPGIAFRQNVVREANLRITNNFGALVYDGPIPSRNLFALTLGSTAGRNVRDATTGLIFTFYSALRQDVELSVIPGALFFGEGSATLRTLPTTLTVVGAGRIEFAGIGSASLRTSTPTLTKTSPSPVAVSGAGEATLRTLPAALSVTTPTPVTLSGAGSATLNIQANRQLRVFSPDSVPWSGEGEATLNIRGATLDKTGAGSISFGGAGSASFNASTAQLDKTSPTPVSFSGAGSASFALRSTNLIITSAGGITFAGFGQATFISRPVLRSFVIQTRPTPVPFGGYGEARFRNKARRRLQVRAVANVEFSGSDEATFRAVSVILTRRGPGRVGLSGIGSATFTTTPVTLGATTPTAVSVIGSGQATFSTVTLALTVTPPVSVPVSGEGQATVIERHALLSVTSPNTIPVSGEGEATFSPSTVALQRTSPTAVPFEGAGEATFRPPFSITLRETPPAAVRFDGHGAATLTTQPVTLRIIVGIELSGSAEATLTALPAVLGKTAPTAVPFDGQGSTALRTLGARNLSVTSPTAITVSGEGTASVRRRRTVLARTIPTAVPFEGHGQAALTTVATLLGATSPTPVTFDGSGAVTFRPATAAPLQGIAPTPVTLSGAGEATFSERTTALTIISGIDVAGIGSASLTPTSAPLSATSPTPVPLSGAGEATFTEQATTLTVSSPISVPISGEGQATFSTRLAELSVIGAGTIEFSGEGEATFVQVPAVLSATPATPVPFDGSGQVTIRDVATASLQSTSPVPVSFGGVGSASFVDQTLTITTIRGASVSGIGTATLTSVPAIMSREVPVAVPFGGHGAASLRNRRVLRRRFIITKPTALDFSGLGSAAFRDVDAVTLSISDAGTVAFSGRGQATFVALSSASLNAMSPIAVSFGAAGQANFDSMSVTLGTTPQMDVAFSGEGQASIREVAAPLSVTDPASVPVGGLGRASFETVSVRLARLPQTAVTFGGKGQATMSDIVVTLSVTSPLMLSISGEGSTQFRDLPVVLTRTVPHAVTFSGEGEARLTPVPAVLQVTRPTAIPISGEGEATFLDAVTIPMSRTTPTPVTFSGAGGATFDEQTAVLSIVSGIRVGGTGLGVFRASIPVPLAATSPSAVAFTGSGTGTFAPNQTQLQVTASTSVTLSGGGQATLNTTPIPLAITEVGDVTFSGYGQATFATAPISLRETSPAPVPFSGIGQATFTTLAVSLGATTPIPVSFSGAGSATLTTTAINLSETSPLPVSFSGFGEATFTVQTAVLTDMTVPPVPFSGAGSATFATQAVNLGSVAPTSVSFVGAGEAIFTTQAVNLSRTSPLSVSVSGMGLATFTTQTVNLSEMTVPPVPFSGSGEAMFTTQTVTLSGTAVTDVIFVGFGQATFATAQAISLGTTAAEDVLFTGAGEAVFTVPVATLTRTSQMNVVVSGEGDGVFQDGLTAILLSDAPLTTASDFPDASSARGRWATRTAEVPLQGVATYVKLRAGLPKLEHWRTDVWYEHYRDKVNAARRIP